MTPTTPPASGETAGAQELNADTPRTNAAYWARVLHAAKRPETAELMDKVIHAMDSPPSGWETARTLERELWIISAIVADLSIKQLSQPMTVVYAVEKYAAERTTLERDLTASRAECEALREKVSAEIKERQEYAVRVLELEQRISDASALLLASADPFDKACSILRS